MKKLILVNGYGGKTTFSLILKKFYESCNINTKLLHLDKVVCEVASEIAPKVNPSTHLGSFYQNNEKEVLWLAAPKLELILKQPGDILIVEGVYTGLLKYCVQLLNPHKCIQVTIRDCKLSIDNILTMCDITIDHPGERNVVKLTKYIEEHIDSVEYITKLKTQSQEINNLL